MNQRPSIYSNSGHRLLLIVAWFYGYHGYLDCSKNSKQRFCRETFMAKRGSVDIEKCAELNDLEENRVSECGGCSQRLPNDKGNTTCKCAWNDAIKDVQPSFLDMITEVVSHPTVRRLWSFFMVLFVLGTIQSITICGAVYIYPQFLDPNEASFYIHWCLCLCFWANTNLNYAEAVLRDPGFVGPSECGAAVDFCQRCQQGKPAGSHHCRICRRCVQNMDHHCPFIGNCVGRSNRRAFVLFLFWSASSLAYVLTITTIYCFDHSEVIVKNFHEAIDHLPPLKSATLAFYLHRLVNHKYVGIHLHAVGFLLLLGSVTFLMTFSLLIQQIRLICEGQTTISRLQAQRLARGKHLPGIKENHKAENFSKSTKTCLQNWQDIFGNGPCCCFLMPRIPFFDDLNRPAKHV